MGLLANHPLIKQIAAAAAQAAAQRLGGPVAPPPTPGQVASIASQTATAVASDPVVANNLNAEPLPQSRTFVSALGQILLGLLAEGVGIAIDNGELKTFGAGAVVLGLTGVIGRVSNGLAPINWARPWTLLGIGR